MVQTIAISENISLKYLKENFDLSRIDTNDFFLEWQNNLPNISNEEIQFLNRIKNRYFYQLDESILLEEGVKMMIVSPLLEIAGFYDSPFKTKFESTIKLNIDTKEEILQGRIDVLVVQNQFWIWVLEAKRTTFSLALGIPKILAYMLANPNKNQPTFGILTSGEDFIFLKLLNQPKPIYNLSKKFSILNDGDLEKVLQIMKKIGKIIIDN